MSKFESKCPQCGIGYQAEEEWIGKVTDCPNCGKEIIIQPLQDLSVKNNNKPTLQVKRIQQENSPEELKECPFCAEQINVNAYVCDYCESPLSKSPAAKITPEIKSAENVRNIQVYDYSQKAKLSLIGKLSLIVIVLSILSYLIVLFTTIDFLPPDGSLNQASTLLAEKITLSDKWNKVKDEMQENGVVLIDDEDIRESFPQSETVATALYLPDIINTTDYTLFPCSRTVIINSNSILTEVVSIGDVESNNDADYSPFKATVKLKSRFMYREFETKSKPLYVLFPPYIYAKQNEKKEFIDFFSRSLEPNDICILLAKRQFEKIEWKEDESKSKVSEITMLWNSKGKKWECYKYQSIETISESELAEKIKKRISEINTLAEKRITDWDENINKWVEDNGLVPYEDGWIRKEDLSNFENIAKGMVKYNNEWMTPSKRNELIETNNINIAISEFKNSRVLNKFCIDSLQTAIKNNPNAKNIIEAKSILTNAIADLKTKEQNEKNRKAYSDLFDARLKSIQNPKDAVYILSDALRENSNYSGTIVQHINLEIDFYRETNIYCSMISDILKNGEPFSSDYWPMSKVIQLTNQSDQQFKIVSEKYSVASADETKTINSIENKCTLNSFYFLIKEVNRTINEVNKNLSLYKSALDKEKDTSQKNDKVDKFDIIKYQKQVEDNWKILEKINYNWQKKGSLLPI